MAEGDAYVAFQMALLDAGLTPPNRLPAFGRRDGITAAGSALLWVIAGHVTGVPVGDDMIERLEREPDQIAPIASQFRADHGTIWGPPPSWAVHDALALLSGALTHRRRTGGGS